MSRKRTPRRYSSELDDPSAQGDGTSKHTQYSPESAQASSPTTGSVNVAQRRSPSSQHDFTTAKHSDRPLSTGSSITASSLDGLSWYKAGDEDEDESDYGTMDGEDDGNTTPTRSTFLESPPRKRGIVSQTSQEDEEAYTELSRRAEAILANAKRRLNVLDENLRGARALTTENLQRAASLHVASGGSFIRDRFFERDDASDAYTDPESPALERGGLAIRGGSLDKTPHRAQSAMARTVTPNDLDVRERGVGDSAVWTANHLRGTRSQEFSHDLRANVRSMREISSKSALKSLPEREITMPPRRNEELPSPVTRELQQQMQDLKGRISSLRERARVDSLRRQSLHHIQTSTPLTDAPLQIQMYGPSETNDVRETATDDHRVSPLGSQEANQVTDDPNVSGDPSPMDAPAEGLWLSPKKNKHLDRTVGSLPAEAAGPLPRPMFQAHWRAGSRDLPNIQSAEVEIMSAAGSIIGDTDDHDGEMETKTETGDEPESASVYQTPAETTNPFFSDEAADVQRHEDRDDAFDYQHFFLHSGMGRPLSVQSDCTTDSGDTARAADHDQDTDEDEIKETPEKLRQIESDIRQRTLSRGSLSSVSSFITAVEPRSGRQSPEKKGAGSDGADSGVALPDKSPFAHKRSMSDAINSHIKTIAAPPAAIAVSAMIDNDKRALGMKDKALIFMVVESLRQACFNLQTGDSASSESMVLRRRLEEARKVLDGIAPVVS